MPINSTNPAQWNSDTAASVYMYNTWFLKAAPEAYQDRRVQAFRMVEEAFSATEQLRKLSASTLLAKPTILPVLRMMTAPPIARDRLTGLSGVNQTFVNRVDKEGKFPPKTPQEERIENSERICEVIEKLLDPLLYPWLNRGGDATEDELLVARSVLADRVTGAQADPVIRNAQEERQLGAISTWLESRSYKKIEDNKFELRDMPPGTYSFRTNVLAGHDGSVRVPVDVVIQPRTAVLPTLPLLVEAKSAGDFTNVNKRRKEEAQKLAGLRKFHGPDVQMILFLCGYFDAAYLGYEAAEGLDWVWEHRVDDFTKAGL